MGPITTITEAEYYQKLGKSHNPPDADMMEEAFDKEYYKLYDEVEAIFDRCGKNDAFGDGDFCLSPHIAKSRGLGLEVTNTGIVSPALLEELSSAIRISAPGWEVYLGSGNFDFAVFISADSALLWRRDPAVLPLFAGIQ